MSSIPELFKRSHAKKAYVMTADDVKRVDPLIEEFVKHLVNAESRKLFGNFDIGEKLCKSFLSICLTNENKDRVAVMCLNDHPNVPSIPPWEWNHWLFNIYKLNRIGAGNTLWVHCMIWDTDYKERMAKPLLEGLFRMCWYLEYVILVAPPGSGRLDWLKPYATRIFPQGDFNPKNVQTLYLMVRQNFVTKYKIRRAVEEDNDDLVPLVHDHTHRLQELYGEYYVAELLTRHPDDGRQMIVAEEGGNAVAMVCLNEAVNYDILNQHFEMLPYYGLRKPHPDDSLDQLIMPHPCMSTPSLVDDHVYDHTSTTSHISRIADDRTLVASSSIESYESEIELEVHSEESEDDFTIVSVTSLHLDDYDHDEMEPMVAKESQCSAMMLSFNEYEMHLYADKSKLKSVSFEKFEQKTSQYMRGSPMYHGEGNAFTVELAVSQPEHDDAKRLLLEAAFECFPDKTYCVLAVPSTFPPFPLLEYFVRASPRPVSSFPHEIYVLHRNSITGSMSVRQAVQSDLDYVEDLFMTIPKSESMMNDFAMAICDEDSDLNAFVFLSETQIIGMAVLKEEGDVEYLKTHYELMDWMDEYRHKAGSSGVLDHFVVSPIFQKHCRYFLRELHRLSDYSIFYYKVTPADNSSMLRERCLAGVLGDLILVKPRLKPEFTHTNLEECGPAEVVHRIDNPFALHLSTTRHCSLPRFQINTRIVVVGSSDTAIAFLESLICTTNITYQVTFTNVTVVAPHGLNYQKAPHHVRGMLFVTSNNLSHRHMQLIALGQYVNVVNGVMTAIDRKNKQLIVNDNSYLTYDLLFLMCGAQFQKPKVDSDDKQRKVRRNEFPDNVFIINTEIDGANSLSKLKNLTAQYSRTKYNIIVYGHCLMAYCCVAALLEYGVPGDHLCLVDPFPDTGESQDGHDVSFFNDSEVDAAVQKSIRDVGVTLYNSYSFVEWNYMPDENRITSVKFVSKTKLIDIECIALFIYCEKSISTRTFLAINRAGLVFDGLLVISSDCRTNDPYILAAGSLTKYSRRYYANNMAPKYKNQYEIGAKLGLQIRKELIPFRDEEKYRPWEISCKTGEKLIPRYEQPISKYCILPGGLHYLSVTKPGLVVPLEVAMGNPNYGKVLVTGDCKTLDRQGYFRLHLNHYHAVETITCLAKFPIDRINLTSIWGKHERLLNNLAMRFEMLLITDLFEYFREPWACAIYHDRYKFLEESTNEIMSSLTLEIGESLIEDLIDRFLRNDWTKLSKEERQDVEDKFIDSPYHKILEQKVLEFLEDNYSYLPMYAHPSIVKMILQNYESSPMFSLQ